VTPLDALLKAQYLFRSTYRNFLKQGVNTYLNLINELKALLGLLTCGGRFVKNNSFLIFDKLNTLDVLPPSCSDGLINLFIQIN